MTQHTQTLLDLLSANADPSDTLYGCLDEGRVAALRDALAALQNINPAE